MANTVTSLSYANTFGEWVVATNSLIRENNDLAANDYVKSTGTIYLNETTQNALQSNGTVIIQKQLLVQGTGSSATVQNNLNVGSQLYLTNTSLSLVASGQANVAGQINGQASGIGLFIANNAHIGGTTVSAVRVTTGVLQANSSVNTSNASIVNTVYTKDLQANSTVNTATASVTGTTFTNVLQANTSVNTATASVTGTTFTDILQAFNSTNTGNASITGTVYTNVLQANTKLDGNNAAGFLNSLQIQGGGLTVNGNFVITGTTVYTSNTFILSSNVSSGISSYYNVDRGNTGVDASFSWNEPNKIWEILNVTSNTYYRVLTDEYLNDTLTSTSTTYVATANSVNALNTLYNTSNTFLQAGVVSNGLYANGAFIQANAAYNSQNTTGSYANSAFSAANTADSKAVTAGSYANSAYTQANTATNNAAGASLYANGAFLKANAAYNSQNTSGSYANSAYTQANTATNNAAGASSYANGAFRQANAAYAQANTTATSATNASNLSSGTVSLARLSGITTAELSATAGITNAQLANNTISGVDLGGSLLSHTAGSYLVGNTYNGSTAQTWSVNATTTNTSGAIAARDGSGDIYATVFRGLATSANYADLAEKYTTPEVYPVGTVVVINTGDESEGIKSSGISQLVLGVVSEKPAFLMNTDAPGQPLALRGRVPVRVRGPVKKGQTLVSFSGGTATVGDVNRFAQALETNLSEEEKLVEAVIL